MGEESEIQRRSTQDIRGGWGDETPLNSD